MYRKPVTREEVLTSRMVCPPLTLLMLCAPNEGAAAAVLMSNEEAKRRGIPAPVVCAPSHSSRRPRRLVRPGCRLPAAPLEPDARAAELAYEEAEVDPADIDLVECQDTDSGSELLAYGSRALQGGDEAALLRSGDTALAAGSGQCLGGLVVQG